VREQASERARERAIVCVCVCARERDREMGGWGGRETDRRLFA